ncbi:MAG: bifunctional proline dehydrogenase/L-glutamate gamma-semialdehyde dehydrogenase PutA [Pseudomonadota bacterium]
MRERQVIEQEVLSRSDDFSALRALHTADERSVVHKIAASAGVDRQVRAQSRSRAIKLINQIRASGKPGLMELFLAEYGLSTNEGIALMCLAEALLRIPDPGTIDALIEDKISPYEWQDHAGHSASAVVNASTAGLILAGRILDDDDSNSVLGLLQRTVKRLGEPVVRTAVRRIMREMGNQFVLGQTIEDAIKNGASETREGFRFSYDMLGEAAITSADAQRYFDSYAGAIDRIGAGDVDGAMHDRPGISIKLSALHPRYELAKLPELMVKLAPRLLMLAQQAKSLNLGLNVDAEESERLEPSLHLIRQVLQDPSLEGWDGFGVVVQGYQKRASAVIDWLYKLAADLDRKIMVRLVKGAYWDTEIKRAQVLGTESYPVFTRRAATDAAYICCAAKLLGMTDRIYPQFATHNAHTAATIVELAKGYTGFEFQRLHGMGESLFAHLREEGYACRIYAPVGPHKDLLAYLVRRLLENGANSSFVHKVVDPTVPAEELAGDPFEILDIPAEERFSLLPSPTALYAPERKDAKGWDLDNASVVEDLEATRGEFSDTTWTAAPIIAAPVRGGNQLSIYNPARPTELVGTVAESSSQDCEAALAAAQTWVDSARERAAVLRSAADLFEERASEIFALLAREAGKTLVDAVAELREAVDFLRYYAVAAESLPADSQPRGIMTCIAPWNFPLAIFTGQIAAALAAGNGVLAKPAESTPLIASFAIGLLHRAGVPATALQCLPGTGAEVGSQLTGDPSVSGVCFTGSTATAQNIYRNMAAHLSPRANLIAETGGINAAIVDSTALPERAVMDVIDSAFKSAGQRCSALRVLYVQDDIASAFTELLMGAMDELQLGDPWELSTDVGPVIDEAAHAKISSHVEKARAEGTVLKELPTPSVGSFVGPTAIKVDGIASIDREVFGPVLHVATFAADDFEKVLDEVNGCGYGLTFGLYTRIDERVNLATERLRVGNIYINRNQIGAVVESQPFGGENLSGTGPKAGGPNYVPRFARPPSAPQASSALESQDIVVNAELVQAMIDETATGSHISLEKRQMAGPTGEENTLYSWPHGVVLCLGPTRAQALTQAGIARRMGCVAVVVAMGVEGAGCIAGVLGNDDIRRLKGFSVVAHWGAESDQRDIKMALAAREGPIVPLVTDSDLADYCITERHCCIDTTAAGGNASLLASVEG